MNKRWLSTFFALCMVLAMFPFSATANGNDPPVYLAQIGPNRYETLQAAIDAARMGDTIEVLTNIALTSMVIIAPDNMESFTIDLKGKVIEVSGVDFHHSGLGTLTITDTGDGTGRITSTGIAESTIVVKGSAKVVVAGGTVAKSNVDSSSHAIANEGALRMTGGVVTSNTKGSAIFVTASGASVSITGGMVNHTGSGLPQGAIVNAGNGSITVQGGTVECQNSTAIYNAGIGKLSVGGSARITSGYTVTILLVGGRATNEVLDMTGGTIVNTDAQGYGVRHADGTNGKVLIKGGSMAVIRAANITIDQMPDVSGYDNLVIRAGYSEYGINAAVIDLQTLSGNLTSLGRFSAPPAPSS